MWAKDASFLFLGSTGSNFPLGTSRCVSSNHLTGAVLKSFKDSCQPKLFQGSLNSCTSPASQQIGAAPLLQGKGFFFQVSLKSLELLHAPSSHSRLNVPEKPPQESPAVQEKWSELRTQNAICGSGRASSCPCHPVTLASTGTSCFPAGFQQCFPQRFPWGQERVPQRPARNEMVQVGQTQLENVLHCKARRFQLLLPNYK